MERQELIGKLRATRALSVELCRPLAAEDFRVQTMPDVSPPWWNLGHTSWFFAKNILEPFGRYGAGDARLEYALNSYYESLGPRLARDHRGAVTRPTTDEVYRFRASVDERLAALIAEAGEADYPRLRFLTLTGIQHEQQHQELLVTEIKHILGSNVPELREPYRRDSGAAGVPGDCLAPASDGRCLAAQAIAFAGGLFEFGNREGGWCWDNELPVHQAYLDPFALLNRLVTNGEYLEFIAQGGYSDPLLWLANGWERVREAGWAAPLYWEREGGRWLLWTLTGRRELDLDEPVCHVSFYEADAFARWKARGGGPWTGARLPTEREWEQAARISGFPGPAPNFLDSGNLHPRPFRLSVSSPHLPPGAGRPAGADPAPATPSGLVQLGGDLWEWTTNHYEPYPGYQPFDGNLMEYNGKFMDNQRVLRGGSCATPASHIRPSYRNFWPADTRFQFSGIRLAFPLR
jgi:ergothioneine biosynthesis protein EgtB